jgi:hypothetical protein
LVYSLIMQPLDTDYSELLSALAIELQINAQAKVSSVAGGRFRLTNVDELLQERGFPPTTHGLRQPHRQFLPPPPPPHSLLYPYASSFLASAGCGHLLLVPIDSFFIIFFCLRCSVYAATTRYSGYSGKFGSFRARGPRVPATRRVPDYRRPFEVVSLRAPSSAPPPFSPLIRAHGTLRLLLTFPLWICPWDGKHCCTANTLTLIFSSGYLNLGS